MLRRHWAAFVLLGGLAAAADFHIDCKQGNDTASGLSPKEAWRTLAKANQADLLPGDRLLLKRSERCEGSLTPRGSGTANQPIVLGAFGEGGPPVVDAKDFDTALLLWNQSYWRIGDIEVGGSRKNGIYVGGDAGTIQNIELRDVVARNVHGKLTTKNSGLIVVQALGTACLQDIRIDGALAEGTTQWAGIVVNGAPGFEKPGSQRSRNIVIRNSIARDVWGDGIVLWQVEHGLIERSAAWKTGMQPRQTIGTPNGIWTWSCVDCTVRESESFWSDSPGVDGGAFDIDWGNHNNIVERSYGHDSLSYCIAVFGAKKLVTTGSVIRGNVCAGLGNSPRLARHHGAIHLYTWDGGSLEGVRIENNLIEWDSPVKSPAIRDEAEWKGQAGPVLSGNTIREGKTLPASEQAGILLFRLDQSDASRGLRVVAESAKAQYAAKGLTVRETAGPPRVEYKDAQGKLVRAWEGYAPASEVLWLVRQKMGPPSEW